MTGAFCQPGWYAPWWGMYLPRHLKIPGCPPCSQADAMLGEMIINARADLVFARLPTVDDEDVDWPDLPECY